MLATISSRNSSTTTFFAGCVVALGVALRLLAASRGYNYDMESYRIVADIAGAAGNVYGETHRYNYGPVWFHILAAIDKIPWSSTSEILTLRWKIAGLLTVVDLLLSLLLLRWFGWRAALLFWLNPIAIIITGYHSQFDNLAVLLGLIAAKMLDNSQDAPLRAHLPGLAVLGISLVTKHILFFLPIWFAMKQPSLARKAVYLCVPFGLFAISFVPYLADGGAYGIAKNVLLYRSFNNGPFWVGVAPKVLADKVPLMVSFLGALALLGLLWRKLPPMESALRYLVAVVTFSAAVANQYLAIPLAAIAVHWNAMYAVYSILGGAYLVVASDGLHWPTGLGSSGYDELIFFLFLGLVMHSVPPQWNKKAITQIKTGCSWMKREIRGQLASRQLGRRPPNAGDPP